MAVEPQRDDGDDLVGADRPTSREGSCSTAPCAPCARTTRVASRVCAAPCSSGCGAVVPADPVLVRRADGGVDHDPDGSRTWVSSRVCALAVRRLAQRRVASAPGVGAGGRRRGARDPGATGSRLLLRHRRPLGGRRGARGGPGAPGVARRARSPGRGRRRTSTWSTSWRATRAWCEHRERSPPGADRRTVAPASADPRGGAPAPRALGSSRRRPTCPSPSTPLRRPACATRVARVQTVPATSHRRSRGLLPRPLRRLGRAQRPRPVGGAAGAGHHGAPPGRRPAHGPDAFVGGQALLFSGRVGPRRKQAIRLQFHMNRPGDVWTDVQGSRGTTDGPGPSGSPSPHRPWRTSATAWPPPPASPRGGCCGPAPRRSC